MRQVKSYARCGLLVAAARATCACSGSSRAVHQQRSDRLERDRGVRGRGPARTRAAAQLGDGAGRCLRRRQRDRRRPPTLSSRRPRPIRRIPRRRPRRPPPTGRSSACSRRNRRRSQPLYAASLAGVPDGPAKAGGVEVGEAQRSDDARDARERRPRRTVHVRLRHDPRRLAADAAQLRARPRAMGRQRAPVPGPERGDAAHRRPKRAHERGLRGGLQRGQAARLTHEHDAAPRIRPRPRSSGRTAGPRSGTASSGRWRQAAGWTSSTARACSR